MKGAPPIELINTSSLGAHASPSRVLLLILPRDLLAISSWGNWAGWKYPKVTISQTSALSRGEKESKCKCLNILTFWEGCFWGELHKRNQGSAMGRAPAALWGKLFINNTLHMGFLLSLGAITGLLVLRGSFTKSIACTQSVSQHLLLWEPVLRWCNKRLI